MVLHPLFAEDAVGKNSQVQLQTFNDKHVSQSVKQKSEDTFNNNKNKNKNNNTK